MGASASVEHKMDFVVSKRTELLKLRNFMVMKAFNLRSKGGNGDLESQFSFLKERIEEEEYIDFKALFDYLKVPQHRKKVLLDVYHLLDSARNTDELKHKIEFKLFQQFMAQGIPEDWTNAIEKAALSDSTVLNEGIALESSPPVDGPPECDDQPECDNGPPECDDEGGQPECDDEGGQPECDDEGGQPECDTENATEANSTVSESVLQEKSTALVARNNAPLEFEKEGTGTMSLLNKKGMWKKREVTIQEKIIEYTKIDDDGVPQNLVEREKQQVEVMHMESADGEFAHRETTHFEQIEELNDKVVHHENGKEEFVHFKSKHDEFSHFESSMPDQGPAECEGPAPSPCLKPGERGQQADVNHFEMQQEDEIDYASLAEPEYNDFEEYQNYSEMQAGG